MHKAVDNVLRQGGPEDSRHKSRDHHQYEAPPLISPLPRGSKRDGRSENVISSEATFFTHTPYSPDPEDVGSPKQTTRQ